MKIITIKQAILILKKTLKKGDIILTKPKLNSTKLKIINFWSFLIGKISRGVTHSCFYLGDDYVLEVGRRFTDKDIKKIKIKKLLEDKIEIFKEIILYVVHPKSYTNNHRNLAFKIAVDKFLSKTKEDSFSYITAVMGGLRYIFNKSRFYKKENINDKKKWHCSDMIAYIIKGSGVPIGKRAVHTFLPSSFLFSKYFKTKNKITIR